MEALSLELLFKALLRVVPTALLFKVPLEVNALTRLLFSVPLALILSERLAENQSSAASIEIGMLDLLIGLAVGIFVSLFFAAATKASLFFTSNIEVGSEEDPWRQIIDSFFFIFLMILFMAFNLERNLLEVLAIETVSLKQFQDTTVWASVLTDLSWLALKISSFGFLFSLTKSLFEEVYSRLGGESLKVVFSVCTWILLLVMSPVLIPSFASFVSEEMSQLWRKWLGVSI